MKSQQPDIRNDPAVPQCAATERGRMLHVPTPTLVNFDVDTANFEHVASCRFGKPRASDWAPSCKWSGDSYRYDIYRRIAPSGIQVLALRWQNGSGCGWLISDRVTSGSGKSCLLDMISKIKKESVRWDYCHQLWEVASKSESGGTAAAAARIKQAFLAGQLRKRKTASGYLVFIIEKTPDGSITETYL